MIKKLFYFCVPVLLSAIVIVCKYYEFVDAKKVFFWELAAIMILAVSSLFINKGKIYSRLAISIASVSIYIFIVGFACKFMNWSYSVFSIFEKYGFPAYISADYKSYNWATSKLSKACLLKLDNISDDLSQKPFTRSLLIVQNDTLILEKYYNGAQQNDAFHIASVTKSIISALIGLAIEHKYIDSVNQCFMDYFPEYKATVTNDKLSITIHNLLTMQGGWKEEWGYGYDWVKAVISYPLVYKTGEQFDYGTQQPFLLSAIITKAYGKPTSKFMMQYLFKPLGINYAYWWKSPNGIEQGGTGLYMTARDLARFGNLYINNGKVGDAQLISKEWITKSMTNYKKNKFSWGFNGYGYLWWLDEIEGLNVSIAFGYAGQYIVNVPALKMTIVANAFVNNDVGTGNDNAAFIYNHIKDIVSLFKKALVENAPETIKYLNKVQAPTQVIKSE
jgi:CubicO group peptidase (beta-lactamase class C family)